MAAKTSKFLKDINLLFADHERRGQIWPVAKEAQAACKTAYYVEACAYADHFACPHLNAYSMV